MLTVTDFFNMKKIAKNEKELIFSLHSECVYVHVSWCWCINVSLCALNTTTRSTLAP